MLRVVAKKGYEPVHATPYSAWFDLKARGTHYIAPKTVAKIPTGVKVTMDKGRWGFVFSRSSLPIKKGLLLPNGVGVIDADCRGEIHLQLYNFNDNEVVIKDMERIGQIVFMKLATEYVEIDPDYYNKWEETYPTKRGAGGFGSTD